MMIKRHRPRRRGHGKHDRKTQLALVSLLSWFAQASFNSRMQHRVRTSQRIVPYQHIKEARARELHWPKFKIPHGRRFSTRDRVDIPIWEESSPKHDLTVSGLTKVRTEDHDDVLWMYVADTATHSFDDEMQRGWKEPLDVEDEEKGQLSWFSRGGLRRLYEQFVGEDVQHHNDGVTANETSPETFAFVVDNETDGSNVATVEFDVNMTQNGNETINGTSSVVYTTSEEQTTQFQRLRIRAILAELSGYGDILSSDERNSLFRDMLSPALLTWSSALRVDPVVGNLTVDKHQLVDGKTCGPGADSGLPSVQIPMDHFTVGIPDTDMIVYLSLGFVKRQLPDEYPTLHPGIAGQTGMAAASNPSPTITHEMEASFEKLRTEDKTKKGRPEDDDTFNETKATEVLNATDLNTTTLSTCSGDYLAAASYCSTDQYDRPTAALLHICIDEEFFDPAKRNRNILTLMHELGHALGFNSQSMAYFRRPDGSPITPRVDGDIPDSEIECTGPKLQRQQAKVPLPSEEILRFRTVRGGVRAAEIVTPSVMQVVRNQFDCQHLGGAELESGESLPLSSSADAFACIGDHWERRVFSSDLMNPIIDELSFTTRISTLTLAYFADSGWYQVDLSKADVAAGWGRGAGCSFVEDTCIAENGEVPPQNEPFFCNNIPTEQTRSLAKEIHGCTPDLSRKADCSMGRYDLDLPFEYRYFRTTYGSDVGGADPLMDYCPVFSGFENGLCSSSENEAVLKASPIERFGERNSRCLMGMADSTRTPLCLPIACVVEDRSLRVKVNGIWKLCEESHQEIVVGYGALEGIICPDPKRICPTFYCPFDCLGTGGLCDYETGQCLCEYLTAENVTTRRVCGELAVDETDKVTSGPFLRSPEQESEFHPEMPYPDSPLSDYYVPTKRSLHNDGSNMIEIWLLAVLCFGGVAAAVSVVVAWRFMRIVQKDHEGDQPNGPTRRPPPAIWWPPSNWFRKFQFQNDKVVTNRNKDKMIASVLVDMRIHNQDMSGSNVTTRASIAETEYQLTESEASGVPSESMSEISCVNGSDGSSDVDVSHDEISEQDTVPIESEFNRIRRRQVLEQES